MGGVADPGNCTDTHGNSDPDDDTPIPIQIIGLAPLFTPAAQKTTHQIRRSDWFAVGGLTDGNMYFAEVIDGDEFRLRDRNGNAVTVFGGAPNGPHTLVNEGMAIVGAGTGAPRLVLDLTSAGGGSPHVLVGVGGPAGLMAKEDGLVSATATAAAAACSTSATRRRRPSTTRSSTRRSATRRCAASSSRSSRSRAPNVAVDASTEGGGFLSFRTGDARAEASNTVTTTVQTGADIFATRDVEVLSRGVTTGNAGRSRRAAG